MATESAYISSIKWAPGWIIGNQREVQPRNWNTNLMQLFDLVIIIMQSKHEALPLYLNIELNPRTPQQAHRFSNFPLAT